MEGKKEKEQVVWVDSVVVSGREKYLGVFRWERNYSPVCLSKEA